MYLGQPWHRYCKTSDNRVRRLIGPNGACPDVTRLSGIYCVIVSDTFNRLAIQFLYTVESIKQNLSKSPQGLINNNIMVVAASSAIFNLSQMLVICGSFI